MEFAAGSGLSKNNIQAKMSLFVYRISVFGNCRSSSVSQEVTIKGQDERVRQKQHLFIARVLSAGLPPQKVADIL